MRSLLLALNLGLYASVLIAEPFEGIVRFKETLKNGQASETIYSIKKKKYRTDSAMHIKTKSGKTFDWKSGTITNYETNRIIVLTPRDKTYMLIDINDKETEKNKKSPKVVLKKTGRLEKICGYLAEEWLINYDDESLGEMSVWGSRDVELDGWNFFYNPNIKQEGVPEELRNGNFFVLRMRGKEVDSEAVEVKRKKISDSIFKVPQGYTAINTKELMQRIAEDEKSEGQKPGKNK